MHCKKLGTFVGLVTIIGMFWAPVQASLVGDTVSCEITPTPFWVCDSATAVVGAGAEFELDIPNATDDFGFYVDIGASSIEFGSNEDNDFGLGAGELLKLADLDWVGVSGAIVGISNFISTATGLTLSDITFTGNSLSILLNDSDWESGDQVSFELLTRHSAVPVPAAVWLFGTALFGLIGFGKRRKAA